MQRFVIFSLLMSATANLAWAGNLHDAELMDMNVMLCDSPEHAVDYAVAINNGDVEEEAQNAVGKAAARGVCDKYIGVASVSEQRTITQKGVVYKVSAYKFSGVGEMRWSAIPLN